MLVKNVFIALKKHANEIIENRETRVHVSSRALKHSR